VRALALLALTTLLLARTSVERLDTAHLAAVHAQRVEWMKIRAAAPPPPGVYQDFRAILHIHAEDSDHTKGTRAEVLKAAKQADVRVVMFTDHRGPKPETWSGLRDGVLFIPGSEDDHLLRYPASPAGAELRFLSHIEERPDMPSAGFQGMEIYNRHTDAVVHKDLMDYLQAAMKDPREWKRVVEKEKQFPDEVFAAGTDVLPQFLARWDKETAGHPFTGIAANDAHQNQIFNGTTFDPYAVAFRHVSTHILARELTEADIRESLTAGRAYVSHDWLCDPTGFSFTAENNLGLFDMGDQVPLSGLAVGKTTIRVSLPIPAKLKLIHDGQVVSEADTARKFAYVPTEPGAYRLEAWLSIDGEDRPWIFSNPIYAAKSSNLALPAGTLSSNVEVQKDILYTEGDPADEGKHKLDLYLPKDQKNFPVLVFVHGGSWRSGDRSSYPALGNRFAKLGIAVAVPSYRLMPKNPHPAQIEDVAAAFAWVYKNIPRYGGDSGRIYVAGHSAGGHLVALLALDDTYLKKYDVPMSAIRGVASISGVYDVSKIQAFTAAGEDSPSPIAHVHPKAPPFLVAYCQWDYLALPLQAREFTAALRKSFDAVDLLYDPGQGHISEIIHVVQDDDPIAQAILKLIQ
jgi:acetyl esterase/lipase